MSTAMQDRAPEAPTDAPIGRDSNGRPVYANGYRRGDGAWVCPKGPTEAAGHNRGRALGFSSTLADGSHRAGRKPGAE